MTGREANQQRVDAAAQRVRQAMDYRKYLPSDPFRKDVELLIEIALAPVLEIFAAAQPQRESEQPALREIIANMPHNGAVMFSSNKNELGHDQSCYKCKLEAALSPQTDSQEPR